MEPFRKPGEVDPKLIAELREMALAGHRVCDMARWLLGRLSIPLTSGGRFIAMVYFRKAFSLGISEVSGLGGWKAFPQATWTEDMVEQDLRPRIDATRARWANVPADQGGGQTKEGK